METNLKELANKLEINLSEEQLEQFFCYRKELKEWNEKINLTAITDDNEIVVKHFIDSLTIKKYVPEDSKLIDVGTGAGFPGIPLKIVMPSIDVTLLDSLQKRIYFLEDVIAKNGLKKIRCIHGRAEDVSRETFNREQYDIVVARAVANLATLAELCLPFAKVGGLFICMKGNKEDEIDEGKNAIQVLGGEIEKIEKIKLPSTEIDRTIICIRKEKHTPNEYPRKAGVPSKKPIGRI